MSDFSYTYTFDLPQRHYENLSRTNLISLFQQYLESGETHKALGFIMELLHRAPFSEPYKKDALVCISKVVANEFNPLIKNVLLIALTSRTSTKERSFILWQDTLHTDPLHKPLQDLIGYFEDRKEPPEIDLPALRQSLHDPFLHVGLISMVMAHTPTEQALTYIRRYFLMNQDQIQEDDLDFLCALGIHNFFCEYSFHESEEETQTLESVIAEAKTSKDPLKIALVGCYTPLHKTCPEALEALSTNTFFQSLLKIQIKEPHIERELRADIPKLTDIKDDVSKNVQDMYEENPYPRWRDQVIIPRLYTDVDSDILIAGCGTGKFTSQLALMYPHAKITGVDLSMSSLSYAKRKAQEYGALNIDFHQGDILELTKLDKTFDLVECSGVLHHMKDPEAGWKAILSRLRPGGRMFIALYSELGRQPIVKAREKIAQMDIQTDATSIRNFRKSVIDMDVDNPIYSITFFRDFFTLSEFRDLVFHVQEKRYTLLELEETMDRLGLAFLGFREMKEERFKPYKTMFPEAENQLDLQKWHAVEEKNPDMFKSMYQFVCCRKDEIDIVNTGFEKIVNSGLFTFNEIITGEDMI